MKGEEELQPEKFRPVHTLSLLYFTFAAQPIVTDSSLAVIYQQIKKWDFELNDSETELEIWRTLNWFSNHYQPAVFPQVKIQLSKLTSWPLQKRETVMQDLRAISSAFFRISPAKIRLYASLAANLSLKGNQYEILPVTQDLVDAFHRAIGFQETSFVLEQLVRPGKIVLTSIGSDALLKASADGVMDASSIQLLGEAEVGDWAAVQALTDADEVRRLKTDLGRRTPEFLVVLYCQGIYVHAFSSV